LLNFCYNFDIKNSAGKEVLMRKLYLIFLVLVSIYAKEEMNFLKTLNEVNEIAFKTKLNIDKTPSNVFVLKRDFIQNSGAKNLFELLKYVPGIQTSINSFGKKILIIRGNKSLCRDKIKFLINGISVTNNLYSNQFYYYNFPAALIKRIEISLTPASVTYGENAFLGVINIITLDKLDDNQFNFYVSNKNERGFSIFQSFKNLSMDVYYEYSNPHIKSVNTYLVDFLTKNYLLYRKNSLNEYEKNLGFGIKYKKDNSTLMYRINYYKKGNFFGIINLPPVLQDRYIEYTYQYLNYNYSRYINDYWKNSFDVGVKNHRWDGEYRGFPYDFNETIDNNPDNDIIVGSLINEFEVYLKNRLTFMNDKHITNYFLSFKYAKPYDYYYLQYVPAFNNKKELKGDNNVLKEGIDRKMYEIGADDLYFFNDNISITYGGRYSHYNDFGNNFAYKIGGIYNLNELTTFKLLYNTAFRAPSWLELYAQSAACFNGNPDLKPEKIKMLEFIYNQKLFNNSKFNFVFYSGKEKNYIGRKISLNAGKEVYQNLGDYRIKGYEISFDKYFKKGNFNLSYSFNNNKAYFSNIVEGIDKFNYLGMRKHLYKGYGSYNINNHISVFTSFLYGSKIKTPHFLGDLITQDINEYFSLNSNVSYKQNNFMFRVGVDNITNHKNYYYALPCDLIYHRYVFIQKDTKIPMVGRRIYITFTKKW
jgi:outer membrane receptor for ferrienterochelin and colicins